MIGKWTVHVENFGKIEHADLEITPMMLFVGDNNSGKSYLMSLLWGIRESRWNIFMADFTSMQSYKECEEWLKDHWSEECIFLNRDAQNLFIAWYNEMLDSQKESLLEQIFSYPVNLEKVWVSNQQITQDIEVDFKDIEFISKIEIAKRITKNIGKMTERISENMSLILVSICRLVLDEMFPLSFPSVYLPASRTGFMLSYKTVSNSIETGFGGKWQSPTQEKYKSTFTLPIITFLQNLVELKYARNSGEADAIAKFLEREALQGQVDMTEGPVPTYTYKPAEARETLPLHVTSSLVTELMPLVLFLKSDRIADLLVIEEPEAHLHLKVQTVVARALVRLLNIGTSVWLTTHSDTFFQQINNLIKLHQHPESEVLARKYGYEKRDFLDPTRVSAYQFSVQANGKTVVERLPLKEGGFVVPTFNELLMNLAKETLDFQGE